jgi:hypothetical protein
MRTTRANAIQKSTDTATTANQTMRLLIADAGIDQP